MFWILMYKRAMVSYCVERADAGTAGRNPTSSAPEEGKGDRQVIRASGPSGSLKLGLLITKAFSNTVSVAASP